MSTTTTTEGAKKLEPVRWGVLGASRFALTVSLPGMKQGALTDVRALASRDLAKARAAAEALGIPRAYGSYEELLADPEIEGDLQPATEPPARGVDRARRERRQARAVRKADRARRAGRPRRLLSRSSARPEADRRRPSWSAAIRSGSRLASWSRGAHRRAASAMQTAFSYFNRDAGNIRNQQGRRRRRALRHRLLRRQHRALSVRARAPARDRADRARSRVRHRSSDLRRCSTSAAAH